MSSISHHDRCVSVREFSIYLGRSQSGDARTSPGRSVLILGPSRSGKTSAFIIPNLLMSDTAVVTTSTKGDVVAALAQVTILDRIELREQRVTLHLDRPFGIALFGFDNATRLGRQRGVVQNHAV